MFNLLDEKIAASHLLGARFNQPFFVNEFNSHLLQKHVELFPESDILFLTNIHDVLPRIFELYPDRPGKTWVIGETAKDLVSTINPQLKDQINVLLWKEIFPTTTAGSLSPFKNIIVLAEAHPYGGLVPALAVTHELRKLGYQFQIWEHIIPVREMFVADRRWELHSYPPTAADITQSWREAMNVKPAPLGPWEDDCLIFYFPLHLYPPISLNLPYCIFNGQRVLTPKFPWAKEMTGSHYKTFSMNHFSQFDPFKKIQESSINEGLAQSIAEHYFPMSNK